MKKLFFVIAILATFFTNVANAQMVALKQFWGADRTDNFITSTDLGERGAREAGYALVRIEGLASPIAGPGLKPFTLMWNEKNDNFTTGTPSRIQQARSVGYTEVRVECYIWESPAPGLIPLKLFWNANRSDNYTTASQQGEAEALAAGYTFIGIEGYVKPPNCNVNFKEAWFVKNGKMIDDVRPFIVNTNNRESYTFAISGTNVDILRIANVETNSNPVVTYAYPLAKVNEAARYDVQFRPNVPCRISTIALQNVCTNEVKEYPLYQAVNLLSF